MPKAAPKNESQLVGQIQDALRKAYPHGFVFKSHGGPYQIAGLPDLIMSIEGLFIGLEVKHKKLAETEEHARGRATTIQKIMIDKIRESGGAAAVVLTAEEALEFIDEQLKLRKMQKNS